MNLPDVMIRKSVSLSSIEKKKNDDDDAMEQVYKRVCVCVCVCFSTNEKTEDGENVGMLHDSDWWRGGGGLRGMAHA